MKGNDMTTETKNLVIRIMEKRDIENARRLHNDDSTLFQLTDVEHVSEAQQESWFQSISTSRRSKRYVAHEKKTGDFVGVFRIDELDFKNRSACVGLDIARDKRRRHYSYEIYGYFLDYLFDQCGLHRLYLVTLETNAVARNLYAKLGFREEGRNREAIFRDGCYMDLICLSLLKLDHKQVRRVLPRRRKRTSNRKAKRR